MIDEDAFLFNLTLNPNACMRKQFLDEVLYYFSIPCGVQLLQRLLQSSQIEVTHLACSVIHLWMQQCINRQNVTVLILQYRDVLLSKWLSLGFTFVPVQKDLIITASIASYICNDFVFFDHVLKFLEAYKSNIDSWFVFTFSTLINFVEAFHHLKKYKRSFFFEYIMKPTNLFYEQIVCNWINIVFLTHDSPVSVILEQQPQCCRALHTSMAFLMNYLEFARFINEYAGLLKLVLSNEFLLKTKTAQTFMQDFSYSVLKDQVLAHESCCKLREELLLGLHEMPKKVMVELFSNLEHYNRSLSDFFLVFFDILQEINSESLRSSIFNRILDDLACFEDVLIIAGFFCFESLRISFLSKISLNRCFNMFNQLILKLTSDKLIFTDVLSEKLKLLCCECIEEFANIEIEPEEVFDSDVLRLLPYVNWACFIRSVLILDLAQSFNQNLIIAADKLARLYRKVNNTEAIEILSALAKSKICLEIEDLTVMQWFILYHFSWNWFCGAFPSARSMLNVVFSELTLLVIAQTDLLKLSKQSLVNRTIAAENFRNSFAY